ncbi:hypothetical protein [Alienimonas californiensis]|uniref:Secreted protein n=1 Tax=Alienimonas californiensis TaxID=2527989 RepID=A0A517PA86_9PLAN|nr:hypothetical protein [Alienimonas californiensis]QDT16290.1 hypothetical protein CA12_23910 [Alienimonas californiensis]
MTLPKFAVIKPTAVRFAAFSSICLLAGALAGCGGVESGQVQLDPATEQERAAQNEENDRLYEEQMRQEARENR